MAKVASSRLIYKVWDLRERRDVKRQRFVVNNMKVRYCSCALDARVVVVPLINIESSHSTRLARRQGLRLARDKAENGPTFSRPSLA